MNTLEAISGRRSIRRFENRAIPQEMIEKLLDAAVQAPSAKNAQPWRFVVLEGEQTQELAQLMHRKADALTNLDVDIGSLAWTAQVIEQAPVTIMIFNALPSEISPEFHDDYRWVMLQSTGGAIQTMLLTAQELGLGSLWICDVLYVTDEIKQWLDHAQDDLVAAVSLGYAAESPGPRPRRPWQEVTEWNSHPASA